MRCCTVTKQKFWLSGCSVTFLLLAITLGLLWPTVSLKYLLYPQLELKEGSVNYEGWMESPIPIYFEIYMFNWTNSEHYKNHSIKPHFDEMGPYVFSEKHERTNITWNDNATVTFYQKRIWHFEPLMSNGSLSDVVTNLNPIAATVAYAARELSDIMKLILNAMMSPTRGPLFVSKTVGEILFDGYDDPLLTIVRANANPDFPKPPFDKFGWFVDRNGSEIYDGNFTMHTGVDDINKLGILQLWNGQSSTGMYRDDCGEVLGTTGELWPPISKGDKPDLKVFATDVCRTVTIKYDSDYSSHGINGYKWTAGDWVFDNGQKYPETKCYCNADEDQCPDLMPGVFNASKCKFDTPAFVSFPHFYLADKSYTDVIDGMNPNKEDHEFSIAMEPRTGIPLSVRAQMQINLLLKPYAGFNTFKEVPTIFCPMFFFRQVAELNEEIASQARIAVMIPDIGLWIAYGLASIGGLLIIIGILCLVLRWRKETDVELLS